MYTCICIYWCTLFLCKCNFQAPFVCWTQDVGLCIAWSVLPVSIINHNVGRHNLKLHSWEHSQQWITPNSLIWEILSLLNNFSPWSIFSAKLFWYYVFSVRCRASVVPCCSSHVLLFCLSSTSCTSLALFKLLYSSPAFLLRTLRRSQDTP